MASKFFTWTKGDRRNAAEALRSGGIVPIPVECISIKGMDYARTARGSKKVHPRPKPLLLDGSPEQASKHSSRTNDSIALQDAAVQSATNLMHMMSDMLRSPPMSAHIFSQNYEDALNSGSTLKPMHGRPRSKTAPSTPLAEAPMIEPVELPGSFPPISKPSLTRLPADYVHQRHLLAERPAHTALAGSIARPYSSPQEAIHPVSSELSASSPRTSPRSNFLSPTQASPRAKSASPGRNLSLSLLNDSAEDTLVANENPTTTQIPKRPTLSPLSDDSSRADSGSTPSLATSRPCNIGEAVRSEPTQDDRSQQSDSETMLMEQLSSLRASHEDHTNSLKESHEKEIASYRSYISLLESRRSISVVADVNDKQALTIDTSHGASRPGELLTSVTSATTIQSFEMSLENSASHEASQGKEALKRKLSLYRKAQADAVDVRRERDQLRDSVARSDRRVSQLKDIVRKAKDNERALKNATADLEARLVLANNERTDVLEGYHEACAQVQDLSIRGRALSKQLERVNTREAEGERIDKSEVTSRSATEVQPRCQKHHGTIADAEVAVVKDCDALLKQVEELRQTVVKKDAHIRRLEEVVSAESDARRSMATRSMTTSSSWLSELQNSLEQHKQMLATSRAESEMYNSLLQSELRRQSRAAADSKRSTPKSIDSEASRVATEKLGRLRRQSITITAIGSSPDVQKESMVAILEKEVQHCIKEIIMVKSDLKACKKDLKRAHAKIESLSVMDHRRPPTPDGDNATRSDQSPRLPPRTSSLQSPPDILASIPDSGLGISLHTPTKTAPPALNTSTLPSPTPTPKPKAPPTLSTRSKTPICSDKKLPDPPSSEDQERLPVTPPDPSIKLQRNETLRSLSESIISSYTKRDKVEQEPYSTPPRRDRRSAPLQSMPLISPMAPASRSTTPRQTPIRIAIGD